MNPTISVTSPNQSQVISQENRQPLLQLPAIQLLDLFGAGKSIPGAGSASALEGIISCKLLRTAITLTRTKRLYEKSTLQLNLVDKSVLDEIEPLLIDLFQRDAEQFSRVIAARIARDAASDPKEKKRMAELELKELKTATEIPLTIAKCGLRLAKHGLDVFDLGYKSVRGDSAVAICSANSATSGAIAVAYLNLKKFNGDKWAIEKRNLADDFSRESEFLRQELIRRISDLKDSTAQNPNVFLN